MANKKNTQIKHVTKKSLIIVFMEILVLLLLTTILAIWPFSQSALPSIFTILLAILLPGFIAQKFRKTNLGKSITFLKLDRTEIGLKGLPTWADLGLAPIGFGAYFLFALGLTSLLFCLPWPHESQMPIVNNHLLLSNFDTIILFLNLAVIVPIAEEIIFRGWLYGKMQNSLLTMFKAPTSTVISMLVVSLLFGVFHGQWDAAANMFAMSIVLCAMRETTGTIYSGMLMHIIKNTIAFCVIMFA
jgi:membrane protease YdiL (CAAX protease family)